MKSHYKLYVIREYCTGKKIRKINIAMKTDNYTPKPSDNSIKEPIINAQMCDISNLIYGT